MPKVIGLGHDAYSVETPDADEAVAAVRAHITEKDYRTPFLDRVEVEVCGQIGTAYYLRAKAVEKPHGPCSKCGRETLADDLTTRFSYHVWHNYHRANGTSGDQRERIVHRVCPTCDETHGKKVFVNTYLHNQAFGGREEGGWWYDVWELVESKRYAGPSAARKGLAEAEAWCAEENKNRRSDIHSVVSEGRYEAELQDFAGAHRNNYAPYE